MSRLMVIFTGLYLLILLVHVDKKYLDESAIGLHEIESWRGTNRNSLMRYIILQKRKGKTLQINKTIAERGSQRWQHRERCAHRLQTYEQHAHYSRGEESSAIEFKRLRTLEIIAWVGKVVKTGQTKMINRFTYPTISDSQCIATQASLFVQTGTKRKYS